MNLLRAGHAKLIRGALAVQQRVGALALTAIDYPASFNLDALKKKIDEMIKLHHGK